MFHILFITFFVWFGTLVLLESIYGSLTMGRAHLKMVILINFMNRFSNKYEKKSYRYVIVLID
jgi:hypothetical protein